MEALSDTGLRKLAEQLTRHWEMLATFLGFSADQIQTFKVNYQGDVQNQIFHMLVTWRQQQGAKPNLLETLSEKLEQVDRNDLADKLSELNELQVSLQDVAVTKKALIDKAAKARKAVQDRAAQVIAKVKADEKRLLDEITTHEREQKERLDEHEKALSTKLNSFSYLSVISKDKGKLAIQPSAQAAELKSHPVFVQRRKPIDLGEVRVKDTWALKCSFGKKGSGEGEFESARGIAAAADPDEIAVTDAKNNRVVICNNQGHTKHTIPIAPNDVVAVSNQWVFVNPDKILVYRRGDTTTTLEFRTLSEDEIVKTEVKLCSVAVMPNGNILVGDIERNVLTEYDLPKNGAIVRTLKMKIRPYYLAVLSNGWIVLSDVYEGRAEIVEVSDGQVVTVFEICPKTHGEPVKRCWGVCTTSLDVYLAVGTRKFPSGHIHHYSSRGQFVSCVAQDLYNPKGITFTPDGHQLIVADIHSKKLYSKV